MLDSLLDEHQRMRERRRIFPHPDAREMMQRVGETDAFGLLKWCDSYSRLPALLDLFVEQPERHEEWYRRFGSCWPQCDNISAFKTYLRTILQGPSARLDLMMEPDEAEQLSSLPKILTVFRGAYRHNRNGLSWSLDRDVAARFPYMHRYRHPGLPPILLTGRVAKDRAVLKTGRGEAEIIASRVRIIAEQPLSALGDMDED